MGIAARAKGLGFGVLGLVLFVGLTAIGIGLLTGAAAFSIWVWKWTFPLFLITLAISLLVLAPLSLFAALRGVSAVGFSVASFLFGAILWIWGMAYTYAAWGLLPVIVGVAFMGIGVVPIAMFAALVHADWGNLAAFFIALVVTIGCRVFASWLAEKADERAARLRGDITLRAYEIHE